MQNVLIGVAALACPVGMGAMMWFMAKGMRKDSGERRPRVDPSLEQLREEHDRLGEQIERMEDRDRTTARS
jgi:hypothetical protein